MAHLVGDELIITAQRPGDFAAVLTNIEAAADCDGPAWELPLDIGEGLSKRRVRIVLSRFISKSQFEKSLEEPLRFVSNRAVAFVLFKNHFFVPERSPAGDRENEELTLRVKRMVYRNEEELKSLEAYVSNMEAGFEHRRRGPQRVAISDDVKMSVWARDGGACVACDSKEKLHFDHIIPVAKGGGNDVRNIQILCEVCNLRKSDKIGL